MNMLMTDGVIFFYKYSMSLGEDIRMSLCEDVRVSAQSVIWQPEL